MRPLELIEIEMYVNEFILYAKDHPDEQFQLTPIGCGLAGFSPEDIAPMFVDAPSNVTLPYEFLRVLDEDNLHS